jgi:hypothetical protein
MNKSLTKPTMKQIISFFLIILSVSIYSQDSSQNEEILIPSYSFEHEIHFDVFVKVIKCKKDSKEYVVITAFNESGSTRNAGLKVKLSDNKGNEQIIVVPPFVTKFGEIFSSSCEGENQDKNLRKEFSSLIDKSSLIITVEFNIVN